MTTPAPTIQTDEAIQILAVARDRIIDEINTVLASQDYDAIALLYSSGDPEVAEALQLAIDALAAPPAPTA